MRRVTAVAIVILLLLLGGTIIFSLMGGIGRGGALTERWVSNTDRQNTVNHHAIEVGPRGEIIVAPVTAVPGERELTNTSCSLVRLSPPKGTVIWRASVPAVNCSTHALTRPAIADVDSDESLEVLVGTSEKALIAFDAGTGKEEYRVPLTAIGYSRPTVGNLTNSTGPEVVAVDLFGGVVVSNNGSSDWRRAVNGTTWEPPVVADVDGDGEPEILVGTGKEVNLLSASGHREWNASAGAMTMASGQIDDDAALEVFTSGTRTVTALNGQHGNVMWNRTFDSDARVHSVGDGDEDGVAELYVGLASQQVVALNAKTGDREWATAVSLDRNYPMMPAPILSDINSDGTPEVIAVGADGTVSVLHAKSGTELAAYKREVPVWVHPTLVDLDGDETSEILVRYGDGRVVALDYE